MTNRRWMDIVVDDVPSIHLRPRRQVQIARMPSVGRISLRPAFGVQAGTHRVVEQRRDDDRMPRSSKYVHAAADPVVDVQRHTGGGNASAGALEFDYQALCCTAL